MRRGWHLAEARPPVELGGEVGAVVGQQVLQVLEELGEEVLHPHHGLRQALHRVRHLKKK